MTQWKHLFVISILLLPQAAGAFENKTESSNFTDASKAKSFLRFDINTKKLGFIKSHVTGYVKKFKASGIIDGHKLKDAHIEFPVRELDSDLYARNDQIWNYCLAEKENPQIQVTIPAIDFSEGKPVSTTASISVRGKAKTLPFTLTVEKKDGHWVVSGKGDSTFEALGIPDPSIGVASVDGPISVEISLEDIVESTVR